MPEDEKAKNMDETGIYPIYPRLPWRQIEGVPEELKEIPQPAIVIIGGIKYIFRNAKIDQSVHIIGGSLQYHTLDIQGLANNNGVIGEEVIIGVERMQDYINNTELELLKKSKEKKDGS